MNSKDLKMELLNSEEMNELAGGSNCSQSGDTIICLPGVSDVVLCASFEASCGSHFSSSCSVISGITMDCIKFAIK